MSNSQRGFTSEEKESIRKRFKHTEQGRIYLNHAAISPLSTVVKESLEQFILNRHEGRIDEFENWVSMMNETRELFAQLLHAPSADSITFMGNTSDTISAVAEGFPWKEGDEVILNPLEFPANVQPFRYQEKKRVKLRYVAPDTGGLIQVSEIKKMIGPNTRMVSISAVQYLDGQKADLKSLGELCREHEIFLIVDGIQALGATDVNVVDCHIDAIGSGSHKWLMAPMGIGLLYLSDTIEKKLKPYKTGWLSVEKPWDLRNFDQPWLPVSKHLETGTGNMLGIAGLNASLKLFEEIGHQKIYAEIRWLTHYLVDQLSSNKKVRLLTNPFEECRAGIVSFTVAGMDDTDSVVKQLSEKGITISSREGYFRISPHYYNTIEEIDTALEHLFS